MERPPFVFFAQIESIQESSDLFKIFEKEEFYFYYFQSNKFYYLFLYGKNHLYYSFNRLLSSLVVIQELDTKNRKLRSIRGFLLYALEIIQDEKLITVLETNLQPLFWRKVKNVIKQNKKNYLLEFLFGFSNSINLSSDQEFRQLVKRIESMESEIALLKKQSEIFSKVTDERKTVSAINELT